MRKPKLAVGAFSLVEVTLAIGIAAFCLIAVFGLMPVGVQTSRSATSQTAANNIISAVVADLRATPNSTGTSAQFNINIPSDPTSPPTFVLPDVVPCSGGQTSATSQIRYIDSQGQASTTLTSNSRYRLIITFVKNTTGTATSGATYANVKATWPATIDPCATTPSGSTEAFVALDRH